MGFFSKIKKGFKKLTSAIGGAVRAATTRTAPTSTSAGQVASQGGFAQQSRQISQPTSTSGAAGSGARTPTSPRGGNRNQPGDVNQQFQGPIQPGTSETTFRETGRTQEIQSRTMSQDDADRILSGEVQVNPETLAAVQAGEFNVLPNKVSTLTGIEDLSPGQVVSAFGITSMIKSAAAPLVTGVAESLKVGTIAAGQGIGTAGSIAVNTATVVTTQSLMVKAGIGLTSANGILAMIGSYPFSGFIKEESLQTLSFAVRTAMENGDIEGAEAALAMQRDMLNPETWEKIISWVPFANVVKELQDFYEAARLKTEIDAKMVEDMRLKQETGMTDDEIWIQRKKDERLEWERRNDIIVKNQQRGLREERESAAAGRAEAAEFWAAYAAEQRAFAEADREAIALFWEQYRMNIARTQQDSRPSNLKFGLL